MIALGLDDGNIMIYNTNSLEIVDSEQIHTDAVNCLSFSNDGKYIASNDFNNIIKISNVIKL